MEPDADPDSPATDADFPSGEWIGYYRHDGTNYRQEMHLSFTAGRMSGAGEDSIGPFVIRGSYDPDSKEAWWTKTYLGAHSVLYKGYREIKGIWGMWEIPPLDRDGFHIWPRQHGEAEADSASADVEEPVMAPAR